jgi:hypothetical protein
MTMITLEELEAQYEKTRNPGYSYADFLSNRRKRLLTYYS